MLSEAKHLYTRADCPRLGFFAAFTM